MLSTQKQDIPKPSKFDRLKLFLSRLNFKKVFGLSFAIVLIIATFISVYVVSNRNQSQDVRSKANGAQGTISASPNPCTTNTQYCTSTVNWSTANAQNVCIIRSPNPYPSDYWIFDSGNPSGAKQTNFQTVWWADTLVLYANCPTSYKTGVQIKTLDNDLEELDRISLTTITDASSGIALGVYESPTGLNYSEPSAYGSAIDEYKKDVGRYPAWAWASVKWKSKNTNDYVPFKIVLPVIEEFRKRGIVPAFNWDPSKGDALKNVNQPEFSWNSIASGAHDNYITQFAQAAATYKYPFLIRPFSEMDGNYYPWGYSVNGNTNTADFVVAWKHIVDIFRKEGATNVQFVWCQRANDAKKIDEGNNRELLKQLYPGDDYVDFIALDGYANESKRSVEDEFKPMYELQTSISTRPMIIHEIGASENPDNPMAKANWITQGFLTTILTKFPAVKAVAWMNANNGDINVGSKNKANWNVNTSQNSLEAWRQVVSSPLYQRNIIPPTPTPTPPAGSGIPLGVYSPPEKEDGEFSDIEAWGRAIDRYSKDVGKKPAFAWRSVRWRDRDTGEYQEFNSSLLEVYRTRGIMPGVNWDASKGSSLTRGQKDFSWNAINSGMHDEYITRVAKGAAAYRYPFFIRLFSEVDGPWYPWGWNAEGQGNTNPADFTSAWKRVVDIFRKEGATNVKFVYCWAAGVLHEKEIIAYGDVLKQLYPGDDYVDWIALDGYSNLEDAPNRSLQNVFQPTYKFLKTFTNRPMAFYEVGALENPDDPMVKANWITHGFLTTIPTVFPDVKMVNWFNGPSDPNPNKPFKETQYWKVDTSQNSLNAWKQVVNSPLYQGMLNP